MRTINDLCLLCKFNRANQTNSHITPKFTVRRLISGQGFIKRTGSDRPDLWWQTFQDIYTEDYILCAECESYFCCLETYFSNMIYQPMVANLYEPKFEELTIEYTGYVESLSRYGAPLVMRQARIRRSVAAVAGIIQLFIESILFRIHISTCDPYNRFSLSERSSNLRRQNLLRYKSTKQSEILASLAEDQSQLTPFPYVLLVPEAEITVFPRVTESVEIENDLIKILAGELYIILSNGADISTYWLANGSHKPVTVGIIPVSDYERLYRNILEKFMLHSLGVT